jgi:hypothetical protein
MTNIYLASVRICCRLYRPGDRDRPGQVGVLVDLAAGEARRGVVNRG